MKLTNGLSTTCYRVTTESFLAISQFGGFGTLDEPEVDETVLADTGFDSSAWLIIGLLLLSSGLVLMGYARRRA